MKREDVKREVVLPGHHSRIMYHVSLGSLKIWTKSKNVISHDHGHRNDDSDRTN